MAKNKFILFRGEIEMTKDKQKNEWNFDQEGEMTVHKQISDAYQSGVVDMLDQHAKRSKTEDEESLQ